MNKTQMRRVMEAPAPCSVCSEGTVLYGAFASSPPGTFVVIHAHGRFREAQVVKRTPTFTTVAYRTPAEPTIVREPQRRHADVYADPTTMPTDGRLRGVIVRPNPRGAQRLDTWTEGSS